MGLDTTASDVAMGQLAALPFDNLIGGPLNAAINAQAQAAVTTVNFIRDIGLQDNGSGKLEAINIQFTYQDGSGAFRRLTVPLLTVIPIPFIVINAVDINFKARIAASAKQSTEERRQSAFNGSFSAGAGWGWGSARMSASYSSKKDSKASQESTYSVEYTMDVHVHASQAGLPQGMSQILNILQDGISNLPETGSIRVLDVQAAYSGGGTADKATVLIADASDDLLDDWTLAATSSDDSVLNAEFASGEEIKNPAELTLTPAATVASDTDVEITVTATKAGENDLSFTRLIRVEAN